MVDRENKYKTMQVCFEPKSYLTDLCAIPTRKNKIKMEKWHIQKIFFQLSGQCCEDE